MNPSKSKSISSKSMNRLPRAIQNEIYEFARGDRKYWKRRFKHALDFVFDVYWTEIHEVKTTNLSFLVELSQCTGFYTASIYEIEPCSDDPGHEYLHAIRMFPVTRDIDRATKLIDAWSKKTWH